MSTSVVKRLLIIIPAVVVLTLVSLFMPTQRVDIEGVGTLSFDTTVTLSVGSEVALAAPGTKTLYFENVNLFANVWRLSETAPAAADEVTSVKNGKTPANNYFAFVPGTADNAIYSASFIEGDTDGAHGWCSQITYSGSFAAGNWTIDYKVKNGHPSAHAGRIYARIYRTANDDPTTAQLSKMNSVDGFSDIISFSGTAHEVVTGSFTVNCNQNLTLNNEYVFIILNWLVTTVGGNNNSGVKLIINEGTAESVVTTEWTPALDISVFPTSYDFGSVTEGAIAASGLAYFTVTNNSSSAVNITISGSDMTGGVTWTLSDDGNPGTNIYGLKAGLETGDYTIIVKKNSPYNTLVSNLAASGGTQNWGLQLYAPTMFSDGNAKTGTVTLTATL
jgi:hypothetical protein